MRFQMFPRSTALMCLFLLATGCEDPPAPALRVAHVTFSEDQVAGLEPAQRSLLADLAGLGAAVAEGRSDSLVAPLVRRAAERARLAALPHHLAAREAGLTGERLREAYRAAPEWELRVRHLVRLVPPGAGEAERAEARRIAAEAERRARSGEDFAALAAEYSEEPGAAQRGGLLEPGREGSWVAPFWAAARALEPGEVSPVVETEYGYHVLRLDDRRPVPFEEAARLPLLRRLVPAPQAITAMERWVERRPPVALDPPAVLAAREALAAGSAPDTLLLARSAAGDAYSARDLALAWAALGPEERAGLLRAGDAEFGRWVENEVREAFWAAEARRLGAEPLPGAAAEAEAHWQGTLAGWAHALGYREGAGAAEVAAAALAALSSTGQEARIVRAELPSLRPLLRSAYPVSEPPSSGPVSSSEMRNSESTR